MTSKTKTLNIRTTSREQLIDITSQVAEALATAQVTSGMVWIYSPHTTAGITIQENADPDVRRDLLQHLRALIPAQANFHHAEGNSDAHIKTAFVGASQAVPIVEGKMTLGTWQSIFFCEFDGPRSRQVVVKIMADVP